jgi:hypothetical protein
MPWALFGVLDQPIQREGAASYCYIEPALGCDLKLYVSIESHLLYLYILTDRYKKGKHFKKRVRK